jgi:hypothetical protein
MSCQIMHLAKPGPLYWDFRCLVCGEPVKHHIGLFGLLLHNIRCWRSR